MSDAITPPKRGRGRPPGSRNKPKVPAVAGMRVDVASPAVEPTTCSAAPVAAPVQREVRVESVDGRAEQPLSDAGAAPTDAASLLAYQQRRLVEVRTDLAAMRAANPPALPRDVALLRSAEDRALKAIGELTGATKITEAKIVASDAWRLMFAEIAAVLGKHPDALAALKTYLESQAPPNAGANPPQ